jgi:hypothetical protein
MIKFKTQKSKGKITNSKIKNSTPPVSSPPFRRGGRWGGEFLSYKLQVISCKLPNEQKKR